MKMAEHRQKSVVHTPFFSSQPGMCPQAFPLLFELPIAQKKCRYCFSPVRFSPHCFGLFAGGGYLGEFVFVYIRFPPTSRLFPPACVNVHPAGSSFVGDSRLVPGGNSAANCQVWTRLKEENYFFGRKKHFSWKYLCGSVKYYSALCETLPPVRASWWVLKIKCLLDSALGI